jgi:pyruvate,water dikinase
VLGGRYGSDLAGQAAEHLYRYGDRAMHDLKLDEPTPRQEPWQVLATIRPYVAQGLTVSASRGYEARVAALAWEELHRRCPSRLRRAVVAAVARPTRWLVKAREDTRFCRTQLFGFSREVMWRLGGVLAEKGVLDDHRDVVDLTAEEVIGAFDATLPGTGLRELVMLRRTERARFARMPELPSLFSTAAGQPLTLALRNATPEVTIHPGGGGELRGLGSSGGVVRARARVVLDPDVSPEDCRGCVLIARETDPGWLFLMMVAEGLVVERGTMLSHTAITGRLLGVPTVVSVNGATTKIRDGDLVEIDGTVGTVRILDPETAVPEPPADTSRTVDLAAMEVNK